MSVPWNSWFWGLGTHDFTARVCYLHVTLKLTSHHRRLHYAVVLAFHNTYNIYIYHTRVTLTTDSTYVYTYTYTRMVEFTINRLVQASSSRVLRVHYSSNVDDRPGRSAIIFFTFFKSKLSNNLKKSSMY